MPSNRKKLIPALFVVALLLSSVIAGVAYMGVSTYFTPRANPEETPKQVKISNISDRSFTVSWVTSRAAEGYILYGNDPGSLDEVVADIRDQLSGRNDEFRTHHVTINGVEPSTSYYFKIGSGGGMYDNAGEPFSFTTPTALGKPSNGKAYGKVLTAAQTPAQDTIVYASIPGSTSVSALVKDDGNYVLPFATARTADLQEYVKYDLQTEIEIVVKSGRGEVSRVVMPVSEVQPAPDIIVGETNGAVSGQGDKYDEFRTDSQTSLDGSNQESEQLEEAVVTPMPQQDYAFDASSLASQVEQRSTSGFARPVFEVDQIPVDYMTISTQQEFFTGTAPASSNLQLSITGPSVMNTRTTAAVDGSWEWSLNQKLLEGEHRFTSTYVDASNVSVTTELTFIVKQAAVGGMSAGGAASVDGFPQNAYQLALQSSNAAYQSPSYESSPSASITAMPTPSPTPVRVAQPIENETPVAGSTETTMFLALAGVALILVGIGVHRYKLV